VLLRSNFSDPATGRSIFFLCRSDLQAQASIAVSWSEDITSEEFIEFREEDFVYNWVRVVFVLI